MTADAGETVVVLNPASGGGARVEAVRERAEERGFDVRETADEGDGRRLAAAAAEEGAATVVAAGGDGTLNEVVDGVDGAGALEEVVVAVVPAGTGNNFAGNIGIDTVEAAFAAIDDGPRRWLDLGRADGRPFVNSCVGGLTADASADTSSELKARLGVLAYVLTTLRSAANYEGLSMDVDATGPEETTWTGRAITVLVGNGRRFTPRGGGQAAMEDGLLEVTIVEDVAAVDLMGDAVVERLLGGEAEHVTFLRASSLDISVREPEPIAFSLDGEMVTADRLSVGVRPATLRMPVGPGYDPDPDPP